MIVSFRPFWDRSIILFEWRCKDMKSENVTSYLLILSHTFSYFLILGIGGLQKNKARMLVLGMLLIIMLLLMHKYYTYGAKVTYLRGKSSWRMVDVNLNSEYWILKKTCVNYVLNTYFNYLYIISLYSFLIALYIKEEKPISSASVTQIWSFKSHRFHCFWSALVIKVTQIWFRTF